MFILAKNGTKQSIHLHCRMNVRSILEELAYYLIPFLYLFNFTQVVLGNPATIAGQIDCMRV